MRNLPEITRCLADMTRARKTGRPIIPAITMLALGFGAGLGGCGAHTSVTGEWEEPRPASLPFNHLLVVGISPNSRVRRSFEVALKDAISSGTSRASASIQTAESAIQLSPEIVAGMVRATAADAVLITRLASRKVEAVESASRTEVKTQQPRSLNGNPDLLDIFSLEYTEYEEPGVMSAEATAIVETSVYEAGGPGRLLYVMTTTSEYREDRDDVIGEVANAIASQLRREGIAH